MPALNWWATPKTMPRRRPPVWHSLIECVAPSTCALCLAPASTGLCPECVADLARNTTACPRCAQPLPIAQPCPACQRHPPKLDAVVAPLPYAWPLSTLILAYKHSGRMALAHPLGQLLVAQAPAAWFTDLDAIVPIPLHPRRLAERGFNQVEPLAAALSQARQRPLAKQLLQRVRDTVSQQGLGRRARQNNLQAAFHVTRPLPGPRLLLVDDVMTTGSTLNAAATVLRAAGAHWVGAIALARA